MTDQFAKALQYHQERIDEDRISIVILLQLQQHYQLGRIGEVRIIMVIRCLLQRQWTLDDIEMAIVKSLTIVSQHWLAGLAQNNLRLVTQMSTGWRNTYLLVNFLFYQSIFCICLKHTEESSLSCCLHWDCTDIGYNSRRINAILT